MGTAGVITPLLAASRAEMVQMLLPRMAQMMAYKNNTS